MSLPHVLLTSLLEKPSSGYELARRFDKSMAFFWSATHQQIYRELKRMEEQGWIISEAAEDAGKTKKRTYQVLPAGETELIQWAAAEAAPSVLRDELLVRLRAEAILGPLGVQQELARHLAIYKQQLAVYRVIEQRDLTRSPTLSREQQIQYRILKLGIESAKTWIQWGEETLMLLDQLNKTMENKREDLA